MKIDQEEFIKKQVEGSVSLPTENPEEKSQQIGIIKGLSTDNDLIRIQMRLRGYVFDHIINQWVKVRKPVMNELGIGNFLSTLQALGDIANFSNFDEKEIPKLALLFFEDNYPSYIIYAEEFNLDPKDFNIVNSILKFYALAVLKNAKNAGHRNVVRGTLSENLLSKMTGSEPSNKKKGLFGFLRKGD